MQLGTSDPIVEARVRFVKRSVVAASEALAGQRVARRFRELVDEWTAEVGMLSSTQQIVMHPAYQRIIGMGPGALPLILRELRDNPAPWFWALTAIADEDPAAGISDFNQARDAWLAWGSAGGLI
jgi:hypothetical protein